MLNVPLNYLLLKDAQELITLDCLITVFRNTNLVVNQGESAPAMLTTLWPEHWVRADDSKIRRENLTTR
jgi:hypothetical protein